MVNRVFMPTLNKVMVVFRDNAVKTYGEAGTENYISANFNEYTHNFIYNLDENPFMNWCQQYESTITIHEIHATVIMEIFSSITLALISIPATKVMVERRFCSMKRIVTYYNEKMKTDLYLALSQIKWIPDEDLTAILILLKALNKPFIYLKTSIILFIFHVFYAFGNYRAGV